MINDLIPQNIKIKLQLAFQDALSMHAEKINNKEKLNKAAKEFQQKEKEIQTQLSKLELEHKTTL